MKFLKQSTAATLKLGPFVLTGDGYTPATGLTISQADVRVSKAGGDFAQKNEASSATHDENGWYDCPVDTTDTNTLGRLRIAVTESGAMPMWDDYMVLPAVVYDAIVSGTDNLQVDTVQVGGTSQTAGDVIDALSTLQTTVDNIAIATAVPTTVVATGETITIGDDEAGTVVTTNAHDDDYRQIGEVAGTGLEYYIDTLGNASHAPSLVRVSGYYSGFTSHHIDVSAYNYSLAQYEFLGRMLTRSTPFDYVFPLTVDHMESGVGTMELQFKHSVATYNSNHYIRLDYVAWETLETGAGVGSDIAAIKSIVTDIQADIGDPSDDGTTIYEAMAKESTSDDIVDVASNVQAILAETITHPTLQEIEDSTKVDIRRKAVPPRT